MGKQSRYKIAIIGAVVLVIAAIITGVFGLYQGWFTTKPGPTTQSTTFRNQSADITAGGDVNITYGGNEKVINTLKEILQKKNSSNSTNDKELQEMLANYRKLRNNLNQHSSTDPTFLQAKKMILEGDFEGAEKLLSKRLDDNLQKNDDKEAAFTAQILGDLKELQLKSSDANELYSFSQKLISSGDTILNS